jgi:hypothetical protein
MTVSEVRLAGRSAALSRRQETAPASREADRGRSQRASRDRCRADLLVSAAVVARQAEAVLGLRYGRLSVQFQHRRRGGDLARRCREVIGEVHVPVLGLLPRDGRGGRHDAQVEGLVADRALAPLRGVGGPARGEVDRLPTGWLRQQADHLAAGRAGERRARFSTLAPQFPFRDDVAEAYWDDVRAMGNMRLPWPTGSIPVGQGRRSAEQFATRRSRARTRGGAAGAGSGPAHWSACSPATSRSGPG